MVAACPFPAGRGTPVRIFRLAEALSQQGHDIHVVTYHQMGLEVSTGFKVHRIGQVNWYQCQYPGPTLGKLLLLDPLLTLKLNSVLKQIPVDIIHAHHYEGLLAALWSAKRYNIPLIYDAHTLLQSELPYYRLAVSKNIARSFGGLLDRYLPPKSDHVVTVTQTIKNNIVAEGLLPEQSITVIANGIEPQMFVPDCDDAQQTEAADSVPSVIYTGTMVRYQGLDLLLKAIRLVIMELPRTRLRLVGNTALGCSQWIERKAVAYGIRENIDFIITDDLMDVREQLKQAHVAVLPRHDGDGIPQKLMNYMATGKPIVFFDGTVPMLKHEITGLGATNGNIPEFAQAIVRLLENSDLRYQLGKNAQQQIYANFSWKASASCLENLYTRLLDRRDRGK